MTDRLGIRFGAVSDVGRYRKKNDDSGYAGPHFLLIADGMGGAPAGNLASSLAVEAMKSLDAPAPDDVLAAVRHGIGLANDALAQTIDDDPSVEGMGTTICGCLFNGDQIGVVHLGDSRGYLWRDGELLRLTNDHSWVQSLIDEGRITEEEAKTHAYRSMLLKVLDGRHELEPDLTLYDVREGDRILFCSDGLSGFVPHERIERVLGVGTAQAAAQELTTLALESGSTDNVTVVIGDVVDASTIDAIAEPMVVGAAGEESMQNPLRRLVPWTGRDQQPHEILVSDADFDPEELRYAPRPPQRFGWLKALVGAAVVLGLIAIGGLLAYRWTQQQYYVATSGNRIVIFRGIQQELPGLTLSHVEAPTGLTLSQLPMYARSQVVEGLPADNLSQARSRVSHLQGLADTCRDAAVADWQQAQASTSTTSTPPTPTGATRPHTRKTPGQPPEPGTGSSATRPTKSASPTSTPGSTSPTTPNPEDYTELPQCGGATPDLTGVATDSGPASSSSQPTSPPTSTRSTSDQPTPTSSTRR